MVIRIGIIGVGNCACSLLQGFEFYKDVDGKSEKVPGIMHNALGGYRISDIKPVVAFDIDKRKVGKDLSEAAFAPPNCTLKFSDIKKTGVIVKRGPVLDGVTDTTKEMFLFDEKQKETDVAEEIKKSGAEIMINYLPVGSEKATEFYVNACLEAKVALINAIPVFVASEEKNSKRFKKAGLPVLGDDVKSQVGSTIVHRVLTKLFEDRGVKLEHTYQLNVGGNTDFLNMLDRNRLKSKKISKTCAVQSQLETELSPNDIHIGPSDYIPFLKDKKVAFIRMEGRKFGNVPMNLEIRLEVEDSPNSAGVMIDAIRCAKIALDRKLAGPIIGPSSYFFKHPPKQFPDYQAKKLVEEFVEGKK
ncbi:MAG: inositol-3-phosphate synthase [Candidatus Diapherotrites archaeon]|nr:inositol-3-phosphate synthase [Candidatus Diapherotrites archaeon]